SFFKQFNFVTCSHWLKEEALKSSLLKEANVISIPNPIDTEFFQPLSKNESRHELELDPDKQYILFGAANLNDDRKGLQYLLDAIAILVQQNPSTSIELLLFGKANKNELTIPLKINELGSITTMEKMRTVYNAADLFIIPSLQDNLPNTIMESMACGTPVVGFNTGGIPEMIDHKENGYIAIFKDAEDLVNGIQFTLENASQLGKRARQKVLDNYTQENVAEKYISFYKSLL
ncbi:MAG: glycosyltransferase, partial [Bacteroidetes bacterium]|nr:glycosyltransferase [Bacteroidota bacterium]